MTKNGFMYGTGHTKQWDELIHNGPMFAPLYEPHNIPIIINNIKYMILISVFLKRR